MDPDLKLKNSNMFYQRQIGYK